MHCFSWNCFQSFLSFVNTNLILLILILKFVINVSNTSVPFSSIYTLGWYISVFCYSNHFLVAEICYIWANAETYLGSYQISMVEHFWKNSYVLLAVNYFSRKAASYIFDMFLNAHLNITAQKLKVLVRYLFSRSEQIRRNLKESFTKNVVSV